VSLWRYGSGTQDVIVTEGWMTPCNIASAMEVCGNGHFILLVGHVCFALHYLFLVIFW